MKLILFQQVKKVLRQTMAFSLLLSLGIYAWARILFYEVPFTIEEDIPIIFKTILLCWGMVLAAVATFNLMVKTGEWLQRLKLSLSFNKRWTLTVSVILFISAFFIFL